MHKPGILNLIYMYHVNLRHFDIKHDFQNALSELIRRKYFLEMFLELVRIFSKISFFRDINVSGNRKFFLVVFFFFFSSQNFGDRFQSFKISHEIQKSQKHEAISSIFRKIFFLGIVNMFEFF